ncbi:MAG TPA: hypothetical protein VHU13_04880 [Solirubrobacteraceae bacterium]|jgi:hypothetical protein|nr:hypothetical protein [Solirubrobacteraceae bacterium]
MPLNVHPSILEKLDPEMLALASSDLDRGEGVCCACGRKIAEGHAAHAELMLFEDPDGRGVVVNLAHSRCATSGIRARRLPDFPDAMDTSFTPVMRDHVLAATLLWELISAFRTAPDPDAALVDPLAQGLCERGFRPATQRLADLVAPLAADWTLLQRGEDLLLGCPDDARPDEFRNAISALPPGWLQAAQASKRVLVIYGSGFGLESLDLARVDQVLQAGGAVAGLVRWSGAPQGRRRSNRRTNQRRSRRNRAR